MGAWIEIMQEMCMTATESYTSLLSWERGLKFNQSVDHCWQGLSLLSWERGLKSLHKVWKSDNAVVAPLVGAWIEIQKQALDGCREWSLLSWERGLKLSLKYTRSYMSRRSSRGSVDWNYWSTTINFIYISVAPLVGAWIEITKRCRNTNSHTPSLLSWERGLKSFGKSKC